MAHQNNLEELTARRLALLNGGPQDQLRGIGLQDPGFQIATQTQGPSPGQIAPPEAGLTDVQAEGSPALTQQRRKRRRNRRGGRGGGLLGRPKLGAAARDVGRQLELGIPFGEDLAPELFSEEGLGRVGDVRREETDTSLQAAAELRAGAGQTSQELQDIIARRQAGLEGFTTPEEEALRQNALDAINAQLAGGLRSAAQFNLGRGIQGGLAGRAAQPFVQQAIQGRRGLEADIFSQQIAERGRRLQSLQDLITGRDREAFEQRLQAGQFEAGALEQARQFERLQEEFNLGQQAREIAGRTAARGAGVGLLEQERARRERIRALKQLQQQEKERQDQLLGLV